MHTPRYLILEHRRFIHLTGADAFSFLNNLVAGAISSESPTYTVLLTPQGRVLCDMFIWPHGPQDLWIDCSEGKAELLLTTLTRYRLRSQVAINTLDSAAILATSAPLPEDVLAPLSSFRDLRSATSIGLRYLIAASTAQVIADSLPQRGWQPWPEPAYRHHLLCAGIPDLDDPRLTALAYPLDLGLDQTGAISFSKGCYIGQEVTSRMHHRKLTRYRLVPVQLTAPFTGDPPSFDILDEAGENAGTLVQPCGNHALALLRVSSSNRNLTCAGGAVTVISRDHEL